MRRPFLILIVALVPTLLATAYVLSRRPGTSPGVAISFADATEEAGLRFSHFDGRCGRKYYLEVVGSGAAFFDYDGDGDPDLYLVNGAPLPGCPASPVPTDRLYENLGGKFTDVTEKAGVGDTGYGHGCAVGDYDGDGDLDLYVTNYGDNVLYRNNGDRTFTNVAREAGVLESRWSTSCAFADYDLDGDLDLYVVNYIEFSIEENPWCGLKEKGVRAYCEPNNFPGQPDTLYRNNGDGTFTDVTREAGVYNADGKGLGVAWGDYDNDGDPDVFVANDSNENNLFRNNGNGTFEDVAFIAGVAYSKDGVAQNGMGTAFGDWDNDGWLDLVVTNFVDQMNTLYHNERNGFFADVSASSRTGPVSYPYVGWGTGFFDHDNDGYLDLFVANGHIQDNLTELGQRGTYGQLNFLFRNAGDGTFTEMSSQLGPGMRLEDVSRGAAFADYDLDGDIDILVTNLNGPVRLLRNDGGNRHNWLAVKLVGARHSDAIGARVTVHIGNALQMREVTSGSGYLSQSDFKLLFGLGERTSVDRMDIRWPGGQKQTLERIRANQTITVREEKGTRGQP